MKRRKRIAVGEKIPLELIEKERDLIMKHTFAGNNLTDRLRAVPSPGQRPFYRFTLDDLDELAGYVAAEANHAKSRNSRRSFASCTVGSRTPWNPIRMSPTNPRLERTTTAESYLSD